MAHWGLQAGSGKLDILLEVISLPMLVHVYGDSPIARVAMALCGAMGWDVRPSTEPDPVIRAGPVAVVVASHRGDEERVLAEALTSNRTRDLHDALKRRCLYHWISYPDTGRVAAIVRRRVPAAAGHLADQVAESVRRLRGLGLTKPPGVAEAISWATALQVIGAGELTAGTAQQTMSAVLKYSEDSEVVERAGLATLVGEHDRA
jgi:hypothetical protein